MENLGLVSLGGRQAHGAVELILSSPDRETCQCHLQMSVEVVAAVPGEQEGHGLSNSFGLAGAQAESPHSGGGGRAFEEGLELTGKP